MRVRPALTTAALAAAALTVVAPQALADPQPSLSITPSPGKPGQSVVVSVDGGCTADSATATSDAFTRSVPLSTGSARVYTGNGTIRSDARPGSHDVSVSCPGGATSSYTITVGSAAPGRGVHAGTGGTQDNDGIYVAGGVALVLAGCGYGVYRLRRRSS
ncbi:LPXTG cell wall anchor domain-containing protein OS=Streptomyces alboniger OX=132473 GN=CP975_01255 PE=4 SV=1 [Streptomyces alboniger]